MIAEGPSTGDGTTVAIDIEGIQSDNSLLRADLVVVPASALLEPVTHHLKDDLNVVVASAITAR